MLRTLLIVLAPLIPEANAGLSPELEPAVRLEAAGKPVDTDIGHAAPFAADWDGDGDLDLLVGADNGSVSLYRNTGSAKSPELASAVQLVSPCERFPRSQYPKEARRGTRAKICVADWNGDGLLDLVVGDRTNQKPDRPETTPEQKAEYDRIRDELKPIQTRYGELSQKLRGPARVTEKEQIDQILEEMRQVRKRMTELNSKLPREYETHGWVWLFLRTKVD